MRQREWNSLGSWYWKVNKIHLPYRVTVNIQYIKYDEQLGMNCCSDLAVSFHYINPEWMLLLEYFIYHLRPKGFDFDAADGAPTRNRVRLNTSKIVNLLL